MSIVQHNYGWQDNIIISITVRHLLRPFHFTA